MKALHAIGVSLAILAAWSAGEAVAQDKVKQTPSASYVSGAVGDESRAQLQGEASQFNAQAIFAAESGEYPQSGTRSACGA